MLLVRHRIAWEPPAWAGVASMKLKTWSPDMTDPYAPPPRHRDRSGALLRVVIVAALLGVAVWGYTSLQGNEQVASLAPVEEQQLADSSFDQGYTVAPETAAPVAAAPEATPTRAPPATPAPRQQRAAPAPAPSTEPVPPPSTTLEPTPGSISPPPTD